MITELRIGWASDLFAADGSRRGAGPSDGASRVTGAAWLDVGRHPDEAHRQALAHIASLTLKKLRANALWLLAAHSAWQPDSRVSRHRKLWGSLEARGLAVPFGRVVAEGLIEAADGLRFFGALQLGLGSLDSVMVILEEEPASHLVALPLHAEGVVKALVRKGWKPPPLGPSLDVVASVCDADGVVLWPVGAFDDRAAGGVALGNAQVIDQLLR